MSRTGFRLMDPAKSLRQRIAVRPPAPRPRGAAAAGAPAPLPRGRRLGRLARPGARRRDPPVRRPQPARLRRLRDRGPAGDARRHDLPDPRLRRRDRRDRARPLGPRGALGGAPLRRLRGRAEGRPLRARRRLDRGRDVTWPTVADWMRWRDGDGPSCPRASSGSRTSEEPTGRPSRGSLDRLGAGSQLAARRRDRRGPGARPARPSARRARSASSSATPPGSSASSTASAGSARGTRISFGLLLDEQAERAPDDVVAALRGPRPHPRRRQGAGRQRRPRACSRSASARASTSAC